MTTKNKLIAFLAIFLLIGVGFVLALITVQSPSKITEQAAKKLYQCPMHPQIIQDKPGICPICHMMLQSVDNPSHTPQTMIDKKVVDGRVGFDVSPERQQLIGIKITEVTKRHLKVTIQTVGQVAYDPELFTAIEEYRQAALTSNQLEQQSAASEAIERATSVKDAARLRLELQGLSESQIDEMVSSTKNDTSLVIGKKGRVWIYAQIYESELGRVKPGQVMEIESPAIPGMKFEGVIRAVDPILNQATRTVRVRALVRNQKGLLKPQMSVRATIHVSLRNRMTVPPDAIIHTGKRQIVFIADGNGHFEPREVKVGTEGDDYVEIVEGLNSGEKVVTGANFLLDSESRFKAAIKNLSGRGQSDPKVHTGH